ncbi:ROK family transcriptional regulator [Paenibacillus thalictri]|nr:ROK family transcriptional regulator [Paenibacillus thalictri]
MHQAPSTRGTNLEHVQEMNRALVIRQLRNTQAISRAELAKTTGLQQSTITNIVNDLISWGLVQETGMLQGGRGRRSIGLKLNGGLLKVIGVRLARAFVSAGLFDIDGKEYAIQRVEADVRNQPEHAFHIMKEMIRELLGGEHRQVIAGIGLAVPGPLLSDGGNIYLMADFMKWEPVFIQRELETEFGLPVYVEQDARAGALAEWWFGSQRQQQGTMIGVLISQGIGAGIITDGQLYKGQVGFAGEIGHMSIHYNGIRCECGNLGCLEQYCSVKTVMNDIGVLLKDGEPSSLTEGFTYADAISALQEEDPACVKAFDKAARFLAYGLVNIVNTLNPDRIVLGDDLALAGDFLLERVKAVLADRTLPGAYEKLAVQTNTVSQDPVLVGAGALILDDILQRPAYFKNKKNFD